MMADLISVLEQQVRWPDNGSLLTERLHAALGENGTSVLFYVERAPEKTRDSKCRLIACSQSIENSAYRIAIHPHIDIPGSAWRRGRL